MAKETFAEFQETFTLEIPKISDRLVEFSEARKKNHGLIVEVAAIHAGLTANFNFYSHKELEKAVETWVTPYPKPIIMNHDITTDAVGRVMAAKMDQEKDGTPFTRLQIAVTDPAAIEKIADYRYLTGSVGGKSESALCSVCNKDWVEASPFGPPPCKHVRGRTYKGQLAYLERIDCSFKEYSFVNAPADSRSQVIPSSTEDGADPDEEENGWVTAARFFDLNMDKEEVVEYTESASRNVLEGLKKKESAPLYLSLKGAFLSSLAETAKYVSEDKETSAVSETVETQEQEEDDVLAVTEELSDDLAGKATDEEAKAEEEEPEAETEVDSVEASEEKAEETETAEEEDASKEEAADTSEETVDEAKEEEENADERVEDVESDETVNEPAAEKAEGEDGASNEADEEDQKEEVATEASPQGQENAKAADVDSQFNTPTKDFPKPSKVPGADKTRESDESTENDEEVTETASTETGLEDQTIEEFERRVEELTAREQKLTEENARLKKALHRMLAERVVDTKIALGLESVEERTGLLEDYVERSASSLADSLRDLAKMSSNVVRPSYIDAPEMDQASASIGDDGSDVEGAASEEAEPKAIDAEQVLVDVLMGRRPL